MTPNTHIQQYFSYFVAINLIGAGTEVTEENQNQNLFDLGISFLCVESFLFFVGNFEINGNHNCFFIFRTVFLTWESILTRICLTWVYLSCVLIKQ
jgi:hypothetical protein